MGINARSAGGLGSGPVGRGGTSLPTQSSMAGKTRRFECKLTCVLGGFQLPHRQSLGWRCKHLAGADKGRPGRQRRRQLLQAARQLLRCRGALALDRSGAEVGARCAQRIRQRAGQHACAAHDVAPLRLQRQQAAVGRRQWSGRESVRVRTALVGSSGAPQTKADPSATWAQHAC